jgi:hypothetical protein
MIMARRGKAIGFGVTTGFTTAQDWASQPSDRRPHRVAHNIGEILRMTR